MGVRSNGSLIVVEIARLLAMVKKFGFSRTQGKQRREQNGTNVDRS